MFILHLMTYWQSVLCSSVQCKEKIKCAECWVLKGNKIGKYYTKQEMLNLKLLIWMQASSRSLCTWPWVSLAPNWCQTRPNRLPWLHLLPSSASGLPWKIWPWLSKSWWFPWKFAGSLLVQISPQEQRLSGVTEQKWAVLGSKSHPSPRWGECNTCTGCTLGGPWQGAVVANLSSKSQLFG